MKEKHTMLFGARGGRLLAMDLCCFCVRANNLIRPTDCPHYKDDFEDTSCVAFKAVDNISLRIEEMLKSVDSRQNSINSHSDNRHSGQSSIRQVEDM